MEDITQGSPQFGGKVPVVDPYGRFGTIDPSEAQDALSQGGFKLATPEQINDFLGDKEFGHGLDNSLKAFGAGAARSATFGASDAGLTQSGLVEPNTLEQLQKHHRVANLFGEIAGVAGSLFIAPELSPVGLVSKAGQAVTKAALPGAEGLASLVANPETRAIAHKVISQAGAHAAGSAIEGAVYGLGNSVSEASLGDPNLTAEHIASNLGYGALIGGSLGGLFGGGVAGIKGFQDKYITNEIKAKALQDSIREEAANAPELRPVGPQGLTEPNQMPEINSIEDVERIVKNSTLPNFPTELPQRQALETSSQIIGSDSEFPATKLQMQSLSDPHTRDLYKTFLESGSDQAKTMQQFESLQKSEGVHKISKMIDELSPEAKITADPVKSGEEVVKGFTTQYEAEKAALKPAFDAFNDVSLNEIADKQAIVDRLEASIPSANEYLKVTGEGLELTPYKAKMPFSRTTYSAMKDLVETLNEPTVTLSDLRNVRETMRDGVNWLSAPRDAAQISTLRKSLMDFMEEQAQKHIPDLELRDAFKRYAVNEESRSTIERILGGSISDKASLAKEIKPEDILDKIFSNTVSVKAAKEVLGQKEFDKALASYLKLKTDQVTDLAKNGFSSNKFGSFLAKKDAELTVALSERPEVLSRLNAWTDKLRILPDSPSVNPSGTAKTLKNLGLLERVKQLGDILHPVDSAKKMAGEALQGYASKVEQKRLAGVIDSVLSGKSVQEAESHYQKMAEAGFFSRIERFTWDIPSKISRGAKSIFKFIDKNVDDLSGVGGLRLTPQEKKKKFEKSVKQLHAFNSDPESLINAMEKATQSTYALAPGITSGLHQVIGSATQFLASKAPIDHDPKPLSRPIEPSQAEIAKFNRYQETVENPVGVFSHIKKGTLTAEHMATLQAVYPKLLDQMRSEVLTNLSKHMAKKDASIPYRTRLSLSAFLGQDLDRSLDPRFMLSTQMALANHGQEQAKNQLESQARVSKAGIGKIDIASRMLTPMQASSQRE